MKMVIARFTAQLGVSDALYTELNKYINPEGIREAIELETKISTLLGTRVRLEQIYDSWSEAGHYD